jgi:hypothetical protein
MKTVKEYLLEKGMKRELALELDELVLAVHHRMARLNRQGVEKAHALLDTGRYRRMEQKNPQNLPELQRLLFDLTAYSVALHDRFRLLESYGLLKFNPKTAEYEMTEFSKQFYAQKPAEDAPASGAPAAK